MKRISRAAGRREFRIFCYENGFTNAKFKECFKELKECIKRTYSYHGAKIQEQRILNRVNQLEALFDGTPELDCMYLDGKGRTKARNAIGAYQLAYDRFLSFYTLKAAHTQASLDLMKKHRELKEAMGEALVFEA